MSNKEPSVLDLVKTTLSGDFHLWKHIVGNGQKGLKKNLSGGSKAIIHQNGHIPLILIIGTGLSITAQYFLEPAHRNTTLGLFLYSIAGILFFCQFKNQRIDKQIKRPYNQSTSSNIQKFPLFVSLLFLCAAFYFFGGNQFNILNISFWISGICLFLYSVWDHKIEDSCKQKIEIKLLLLIALTLVIILFFRVYKLQQVPKEMFSDHAEKLLDVSDVLDGIFPIYFERNTGREPIQFYLTAALIKIFKLGINFSSLKIGMVMAGLLTLPFIYLVGKELGNEWVGLFALFFAGIAYWPNVISRVALRYSLYPLATAPTIYFLLRGLKNETRNDFLLAGITVGFGLNGYSPARFLPIMVVAIIFTYALFNTSKIRNPRFIWNFLLLAITLFILFLPLLRYSIEYPGMLSYRGLSRMLPLEQEYSTSPVVIFLKNLRDALLMSFYNNGEIWVHSIPNRPALDLITAAFFFIGIIYSLVRILKNKSWEFLVLLISIPILQMPSIISLAFPGENPSLNRTAGAYVSVFVVAGFGIYSVWSCIRNIKNQRRLKILMKVLISLVLCFSILLNYDLVFHQYNTQYDLKSWNSSEIANQIVEFVANGGNPNSAFVVPYPHWVDTRLVGINAGFAKKDYALWPKNFHQTILIEPPKLFILKPEDTLNLDILKSMYPQSSIFLYNSNIEGKNFVLLNINTLE